MRAEGVSLGPTGPEWRALVVALAASLAGTAVLGGVPLLLAHSVWWLALGSAPSLLGAGLYLGWRAREPEPLYGAVLAILYFGLVAGVLFGGELTETLPDPLPGLATGDSTFFFVWPLLMLTAGFVGSLLGGRVAVERKAQHEAEPRA